MRRAQFSPYPLSPIPFKDFLSQPHTQGFDFLKKNIILMENVPQCQHC